MASTLAQQLYEQQKELARQQRYKDTTSLMTQLQQQRQNMMETRRQIGEQSWQTERAINQGATARGLGSSGLRNMSLIQGQLASGKTLTEAEAQNAQVQKAGMDTQRSISQDYLNNVRQAGLDYQGQVAADEAKKQDILMQAYQMALDGGDVATIKNLLAVAGYSYDDLPADIKQAIGGTTTQNIEGGTDYSQHNTLANLFDKSLGALGTTINWAGRNIGNLLTGKDYERWGDSGLVAGAIARYGDVQKSVYYLDGHKVMATPEEMVQTVKQRYAGMPYIDMIDIRATNDGDVRFYYNGKMYKTYNEAKAAITGTGSASTSK